MLTDDRFPRPTACRKPSAAGVATPLLASTLFDVCEALALGEALAHHRLPHATEGWHFRADTTIVHGARVTAGTSHGSGSHERVLDLGDDRPCDAAQQEETNNEPIRIALKMGLLHHFRVQGHV
jgi:hypothetical protein